MELPGLLSVRGKLAGELPEISAVPGIHSREFTEYVSRVEATDSALYSWLSNRGNLS